MVTYHRRLPAVLVLVASAALGVLYLATIGRAGAGVGGGSIEEIEQAIAGGKTDVATWTAYAQALAKGNQHARAAMAWKKVIDAEPYNRAARIGGALALAQGGTEDEFHAYMRELVYGQSKLAMEIFERAEIQPLMAKKRIADLKNEARAQAMD
jgi:predicted Zn-dependent protease